MENKNQDKHINDEELSNVTGGAINRTQAKYVCRDCSRGFLTPTNNSCPSCGSKNIQKNF